VSNLAAAIWSDSTTTVAIAVANANAPTDDEWDRYLQLVDKGVHLPNSHGLAITDGGGPNAAQRARINKVLAKVRGRKAFSAVVSGSLMMRGLVGALRLFHPETEAFGPVQIQDALRFIGLTESQWGSIWAAVLDTNAKLAPRSTVVESATTFLSARSETAIR
jgi:hypothetical protein